MFFNLLPSSIRKYFQMSKRQRQHELRLTLWRTPFFYIIATLILAALVLFLDVWLGLASYTNKFFRADFQTTRLLISALIGGILTLAAFTLNSLLVVLTTFSGQFSPRMLQNFVKDKQTQHILGIFNGSFVFILIMFLFISSHPVNNFVAVPLSVAGIAFINILTFIYFINHATAWMQVHNITDGMKKVSENIIQGSLKRDLEDYRTEEPGDLMRAYQAHIKMVNAPNSGYVQLINFYDLVEEAKRDNIIIKVETRVGSFILKDNVLFSYWGPNAEDINVEKYVRMINIGHKETEIQDLKLTMNKLSEIAIKALGNDDPKTATNTIHQLADLLLTVDNNITFTPYLADNNNQVRLIVGIEDFDYYLYQGFGTIRHYAQKNYPIIIELIGALVSLSKSIDPSRHDNLWRFSKNTLDHIYTEFIFDLDRSLLLEKMYDLAEVTGNLEEYKGIEKHLASNAINDLPC
ncbi:hypothetical protein CFK37_00325 [Virgibacillus phasianinus]|uniref:DUF2254 domain-containing protein n=1 Tax=Virgibacillus phasianinus TaxID=2017483 RepID=A0A220TYK1_9BACI|nr:DUF2254 domain-containing protein [Virgibacillus phasianinus]ASK60761.1 hypothetical protein CFK37_00325 [Virgibacillus phasianinus]